ncbi:MAG: 2OG-Fe(II) oxygenase [Candidatus Dormibacteraceae bacterium]
MVMSDRSNPNGLRVRQQMIDFLTSDLLESSIRELRNSCKPGLILKGALDPELVTLIRTDLLDDPGWKQEYWLLKGTDDVLLVDSPEFDSAPPHLRFSRNACLRKPAAMSFCLRGLLSGAVSTEGRTALSQAYGERLKFVSADIAKYAQGDYLRRHSDTFSNRRLGLVWFLGDTIPPQSGGELIVESLTGESLVVEPAGGSVAVFILRESYSHLVASVHSPTWTRYSVATHYSLDGKPAEKVRF